MEEEKSHNPHAVDIGGGGGLPVVVLRLIVVALASLLGGGGGSAAAVDAEGPRSSEASVLMARDNAREEGDGRGRVTGSRGYLNLYNPYF